MRVLLTSATRNAGMAIVRALGQSGIEVIGADDRKLPLGLHSRYIKRHHIVPSRVKEGFIEALINVIKEEKPDVFLPLGGINLVSKYKEEFEKHTNVLVPDPESFRMAYDNRLTLEECMRLGIDCPRVLSDLEAITLVEKTNTTGNPPEKVVVKPRAEVGGGYGVHMVGNKESLSVAKKEVEETYGEAVIEEYIPGDTEAMRTLNLIFDKRSKLAAYFTTKKIRQWPTSGGISALSVSTDEWDLVEKVLPFFEKWKWQGLAEVEFKIDSRDGKPKLIEINPRFWGYVGFPIRCGVNFPLIAAQLALGATADVYPKYSKGVKYINPVAFMKAVKAEFQSSPNKLRSLRQAWSDLRGKKVMNNIQLKDPLPILGKLLVELKQSETTHYWIVPEN